MASGRKFASTIMCLGSARDLQLKCARVLHETLLVPVLIHDSEKIYGKVVQMNSLRGLLGILRMNRVPKERIRELGGVT